MSRYGPELVAASALTSWRRSRAGDGANLRPSGSTAIQQTAQPVLQDGD
jgi:hypothetical protein